MYKIQEAFSKDVDKCGIGKGKTYYYDTSINGSVTQRSIVGVAFKIYNRVNKGTKLGLTIVGRLARKENGEFVPSNQKFPSIDEILKQNLQIVNESGETVGGILETQKWSLLANDAWLLGSIHALTEFHFASPFPLENLWDQKEGRPTVMGRELIGIDSVGYKIYRPYPNQEVIAICPENKKEMVKNSTLPDYKNAVGKIQKEGSSYFRQFSKL